MSSSAPPRLQRVSVTELATVSVYSLFSTVGEPPASWMGRFVNRYANRSNGGIPCFSEERSKERADEVGLCRYWDDVAGMVLPAANRQT